MPGLFGALSLGQQSLHVQQQGMEVAGHNLANVNNPAYSRQRVNIATSIAIQTPYGFVGTGSQIIGIQQLRSAILDAQVQTENGVTGFLEAQQLALQYGQAVLGQEIDRQATGPEGSAAAQGVGGQHGLAEGLGDLFNAFQNVSTLPTSLPERQAALIKAQTLAAEFNRIDSKLDDLGQSLDATINADVVTANELVTAIARYNKEIFLAETSPGTANDLRDLRQQKIEELAKLVDVDASQNADGTVNVTVAGQLLVDRVDVVDRLETYDAGAGQILVRTQTGGVPLAPAGGEIGGTISARDGALATLRADVNVLATMVITEVNAIHRNGFSLTGSTGADLFTGTTAADIAVNSTLAGNPALLQASGENGAAGDNQVALALAQLADKRIPGLNNQTLSQGYAQTVANLGQSLSSANTQLVDQHVVDQLLQRQRDGISGVSIDEEMTDLIKFQRAFEASARLISTIDEMLQAIIAMKR